MVELYIILKVEGEINNRFGNSVSLKVGVLKISLPLGRIKAVVLLL